ncbi:biliverdin-producing heme oxygenase [Acidovorax sp.]|uniref:biliverdin-producing heme oxygenase n=1 Tax=Acidovorax sp. TaxID=1872122 RepID=UPI00391C3DFB
MALSDAAHPLSPAFADPLHPLRQATQATHSLLDSRLAIAQPAATLTDYAAHVRGLAAWLQALDEPLCALQAEVPAFDAAPARRLAHLHQDLHDIATLMPSAAPSTAPAWPAPSTATRLRVQAALHQAHHNGHASAARWGLAYVVEGSQLGGLVLHSRLADALAPHPLRYLQGHAGGTSERWKCFVGLLRDHVTSPDAITAACDGALAAFNGLVDEFGLTGGLSR